MPLTTCEDTYNNPPAFALKSDIAHKSRAAEFLALNVTESRLFPFVWRSHTCAYQHILQQSVTLTNRGVSNSSADPANKAKLILLLGGFNNTGELESQLKRISVPPISSEPLHALMIMESHQHSYTVQ